MLCNLCSFLLAGVLLCSSIFCWAQIPDTDAWTNQIIATAANPTPAKVNGQLTEITFNNPDLIWTTINNQPYLKVVSFKSESSAQYYKNDKDGFYNTGTRDTWVSIAPQVQEYCKTIERDKMNITNRLEAYLGLQPNAGYAIWIEMWVQPKDLFRPCPDAEITDNTCELCLPEGVSAEHRQWFNELRAVQYTGAGSNGYSGWPWTQLGYTYDWWPGSRTVGASEFIIRQGSEVVVIDKTPTNEYCE